MCSHCIIIWPNTFVAFGQRKSGDDSVDGGHCFGRCVVFIAVAFFGCEWFGLNHLIDETNKGGWSINKQTNGINGSS